MHQYAADTKQQTTTPASKILQTSAGGVQSIRFSMGPEIPEVSHTPARIQTKLTVNQPGDIYEQEADRMADKVMRMSNAQVQRKCAACEGEEKEKIMRAELSPEGSSMEAPSSVHEVIGSSGSPLDNDTRSFMEPRFGHDFSSVRVHTGSRAAESAQAVNARAYTVGSNVVFGAGQYQPSTSEGRSLMAHELTHVVQQGGTLKSLQRSECVDKRGKGPFSVFVIGSPGPNEISAKHPYQFMQAALYRGVTKNTVWIVEKTGYDAGKVDTGTIESSVAEGCLIWLTPSNSLASIISKEFPDGSISSMTVYSHGLAEMVTLRYGWQDKGLPNYGISAGDTGQMSGAKFTQDAVIEFNSCNTGTTGEQGNIANKIACHTDRKVKAWTGRTSYAEVNDGASDGDSAVHASQIERNGRTDLKELWSQTAQGRVPNFTTFTPPSSRVDGFTGDFEIAARLPETRHFNVPQGGTIVVKCYNSSFFGPERAATGSDYVAIYPHRSVDWGFDQNFNSQKISLNGTDMAIFTKLPVGEYYLEIIKTGKPVNYGETLISTIQVDIYKG